MVRDAGLPILHKPYSPRDLALRIRDVLDGRSEVELTMASAAGHCPLKRRPAGPDDKD